MRTSWPGLAPQVGFTYCATCRVRTIAARALAPPLARLRASSTRYGGESCSRLDQRSHAGEGRHKLPLTPTLSPLRCAPRGEGVHRGCRTFVRHMDTIV